MFVNLTTVDTASLVWRVLNNKWPVNAALIAISTVDLSLISPTKITSGSCLKNDFSIASKVKPISSFAWIWPTPFK